MKTSITNRCTRFVSTILVMLMVLNCIPTIVFADNSNQIEYYAVDSEANYEISLTTTASWQNHANVDMKITNKGDKAIKNWIFTFKFPYQIENIWNASVIETDNNGTYTIKNATWNQDIPSNSSITIGMTISSEEENIELVSPSWYLFNSNSQIVNPSDYSIVYEENSNWDGGFSGNISLRPLIDLCDWEFSFSSNKELAYVGGASLSSTETGYLISNAGYNQNINAGSAYSISVGGNSFTSDSFEMTDVVLTTATLSYELTEDSNNDGVPDYLEFIGKEDSISQTEEPTPEVTPEVTPDVEIPEETTPEITPEDTPEITEEITPEVTPVVTPDVEIPEETTPEITPEDTPEITEEITPEVTPEPTVDTDEDKTQNVVITKSINNPDDPFITQVDIYFDVDGYDIDSATIEDLYNIDLFTTDVYGRKGSPLEFTTDINFNEATVVFHYDETQRGDTLEENLGILWYDKDNQVYEMQDQAIVDTEANTITVVLPHFSAYTVVDKEMWNNPVRPVNNSTFIDIDETDYYDYEVRIPTIDKLESDEWVWWLWGHYGNKYSKTTLFREFVNLTPQYRYQEWHAKFVWLVTNITDNNNNGIYDSVENGEYMAANRKVYKYSQLAKDNDLIGNSLFNLLKTEEGICIAINGSSIYNGDLENLPLEFKPFRNIITGMNIDDRISIYYDKYAKDYADEYIKDDTYDEDDDVVNVYQIVIMNDKEASEHSYFELSDYTYSAYRAATKDKGFLWGFSNEFDSNVEFDHTEGNVRGEKAYNELLECLKHNDIVIIQSHGHYYYDEVTKTSYPVFEIGDVGNDADQKFFESRLGRDVVIVGDYYCLTPAFLSNEDFNSNPDSQSGPIVVLGFCNSFGINEDHYIKDTDMTEPPSYFGSGDYTFAKALYNIGVPYVIGFDNPVDYYYERDFIASFVAYLCFDGNDTASAFNYALSIVGNSDFSKKYEDYRVFDNLEAYKEDSSFAFARFYGLGSSTVS